MGAEFGGSVIHAPEVAHGVLASVEHDNSVLFKNVPTPFNVVRYHSWVLANALSSNEFVITARTKSREGLEYVATRRVSDSLVLLWEYNTCVCLTWEYNSTPNQ